MKNKLIQENNLGKVKKKHITDRFRRKLHVYRRFESNDTDYFTLKPKEKFNFKMPFGSKFNFDKMSIFFALILIVVPLSFVTLDQKVNKYIINASTTTSEDLLIDDSEDNTFIKGVSSDDYNSKFKGIDKRVYVLDEYFKSNNSPLYGTADTFVESCDKYGAPKDCITLAAIAKHETDLCKYHNSAEMFNCIGWGGGGDNRLRFNNFEEMIDTSTKVLVQQYSYDMMVDPSKMETVFCGPQDECAGWGNRVKIIMNQIDEFSVSLGVGKLTDLR